MATGAAASRFNARSVRESVFSRRTFANRWVWGAVLLCIALQVLAVYQPGLQQVLGTVGSTGRWRPLVSLFRHPCESETLNRLVS